VLKLISLLGLVFISGLVFSSPTFAALTISNITPSTINSSDDVIIITASASALQNTTQYLEVGFTKEGDSANYFGFTKNLSDEFYQYKSSPTTNDTSSYFYRITPVNGSWSGQIQAKLDIDDSGFKGTGNYIVRLSKFITSSTASNSNNMTIAVNVEKPATPIPSPSPTPPSPSSFPTPSPITASPKVSSSITPTPTSSRTPTPGAIEATSSEMILGINTATDSATSDAIISPAPSESTASALEAGIFGISPIFLGLTGGGFLFLSTSGYLFFKGAHSGKIDPNAESD
jgi:hypothetical protein